MNTYYRTVQVPRDEILQALDLATGKTLPTDILQYAIGPLLPESESHVAETLHSVKMQPRQPVMELKRKCRLTCGPAGTCLFNCTRAVTIAPCAAIHGAGMVVGLFGATVLLVLGGATELTANVCCETTIPWDRLERPVSNACDSCEHSLWCTHKDYRLNRPCWVDCADVCIQCCCLCNHGPLRVCDDTDALGSSRPALNGPADQWMQ